MWCAHYRKTFIWMQLLIILMAFQIHRFAHQIWSITAVFYVVMQLGALLGAIWASRLTRRLVAHSREVNR